MRRSCLDRLVIDSSILPVKWWSFNMGFFDKLFGGGKPSKDKFAKIMTDALRQAGETQKATAKFSDTRQHPLSSVPGK
jgi:hypothetical protein